MLSFLLIAVLSFVPANSLRAFIAPPPLQPARFSTLLRGKGVNRIKERRLGRYQDFTNQAYDSVSKDATPADPETVAVLHSIVKAADDFKGEDIRAIRTSGMTAEFEYQVFVTGNSRPRNKAIAMGVRDAIEEAGDNWSFRAEGTADSGWILADCGSILVNVMTAKARSFYDLEGRWKAGEEIDLSGLIGPPEGWDDPSTAGTSAETIKIDRGAVEEDDPFWA